MLMIFIAFLFLNFTIANSNKQINVLQIQHQQDQNAMFE